MQNSNLASRHSTTVVGAEAWAWELAIFSFDNEKRVTEAGGMPNKAFSFKSQFESYSQSKQKRLNTHLHSRQPRYSNSLSHGPVV